MNEEEVSDPPRAISPEENDINIQSEHLRIQRESREWVDACHDQGLTCGTSWCGNKVCKDEFNAKKAERESNGS